MYCQHSAGLMSSTASSLNRGRGSITFKFDSYLQNHDFKIFKLLFKFRGHLPRRKLLLLTTHNYLMCKLMIQPIQVHLIGDIKRKMHLRTPRFEPTTFSLASLRLGITLPTGMCRSLFWFWFCSVRPLSANWKPLTLGRSFRGH